MSSAALKIVTLNIQHGGGTRVPAIVEYLRSQDADVVVLTEFRENANARGLRSARAANGFVHFAVAATSARQNSVCIFALQPFAVRAYARLSHGDRHRLVSAHFGTVAVVGVYFAQNYAKASLFRFLLTGGLEPIEPAHIVVGDFNTGLHKVDETGPTFHCAKEFAALSRTGLGDAWRSRHPEQREFSWYSSRGNGFRVDHAFASPAADNRIQRVYYDHTPRESRCTDHSALVVHAD